MKKQKPNIDYKQEPAYTFNGIYRCGGCGVYNDVGKLCWNQHGTEIEKGLCHIDAICRKCGKVSYWKLPRKLQKIALDKY